MIVSLNENGMLLYGTNACGKSALMKSIGLSLIMAQAGFSFHVLLLNIHLIRQFLQEY